MRASSRTNDSCFQPISTSPLKRSKIMNDNHNNFHRLVLTTIVACALISIHVSNAFSISSTRTRTFVPSRSGHHNMYTTTKNNCGSWNLVAPGQPLRSCSSSSKLFMICAPPGSGYMGVEDEESELPESYVPMMEFPGTMRPGRTPENMPFHDLPIADTDPDPVPWPHFQQIEWHHRWDPPHPHPIPMEEFIEQQGRWATPEMEAAMRAGVRRDVRQRREMQEEQKRETLIMDDDDDEDDPDENQDLGEGVFGTLGSSADMALTAAATSAPDATTAAEDQQPSAKETPSEVDEEDDDGDLDDFLLDLGLDLGDDDVEEADGEGKGEKEEETDLDDTLGFYDDEEDEDDGGGSPVASIAPPTPTLRSSKTGLEDVVVGDEGDDDEEEVSTGDGTASINVDDDDDDDLELGLDDDGGLDDGGVSAVPLEDFEESDTLDTNEFFDDGGFDYDGGDGDFDGDGGDW